MNEHQLRTWRPRQPSATLKDRLFTAPAEPPLVATHWWWRGLVPTLACALLTLMAVNYNSEWLSLPPHQGIILSSENRFANPADNNRSVQNHLAAVTFEWTNRSEFTSSIGFTRNTNLSN